MSKSLGNVLDPFEVIDRFGTDALRFYLLARRRRSGRTASVSTVASSSATRASSPTSYGNLASRTLAMVGALPRRRRCPTSRPTRRSTPTSTGWPSAVAELLDRAEMTQALEEIWQRVRRLNRYVEERAPWQLAKDEARGGRARRRARDRSPRACASITVLLQPYMPGDAPSSCSRRSARPTSRSTRAQLGAAAAVGAVERARAAVPEAADAAA